MLLGLCQALKIIFYVTLEQITLLMVVLIMDMTEGGLGLLLISTSQPLMISTIVSVLNQFVLVSKS